MNSFYAAASTDTEYLEPVLKATASPNTTLCNEYNIWSWGFQTYLGGPCTITGLGGTGREQIHIPVPRRTSCPPTDTGPVCLQAHRIYQCRFSRLIAKCYRHVTAEQVCGHHIGGFHKGLRPSKTPRPFPEVPSA